MLQKLIKSEKFPSILLCLAAALGMAFSNIPGLQGIYDLFKNIPVVFRAGSFIIDKPLLLWINDGLMAIFFLLIGLEIKRELIEGHLSSKDRAMLPLIAAIGGMIVPALIYAYINAGNAETMRGWAIPSATDIAFALGVIMALGKKIPTALKVMLVAIAVIDDLGAVIIIALFYTAEISTISLSLALTGLALAVVMNMRGVMRIGPYVILGLFIWAAVLKSGVHATLAGVALGLIIPLKTKNDTGEAPLKIIEHALHPWVAFLIMPVFSFANSGVSLQGIGLDTFADPLTLGIILGLFVGKQLGVMGFTFAGCKAGLCRLPEGVTWRQFYGMALLTGIGFTMSLFIGTLALPDPERLTSVRIGVITGSILSAIAGIAVLKLTIRKR